MQLWQTSFAWTKHQAFDLGMGEHPLISGRHSVSQDVVLVFRVKLEAVFEIERTNDLMKDLLKLYGKRVVMWWARGGYGKLASSSHRSTIDKIPSLGEWPISCQQILLAFSIGQHGPRLARAMGPGLCDVGMKRCCASPPECRSLLHLPWNFSISCCDAHIFPQPKHRVMRSPCSASSKPEETMPLRLSTHYASSAPRASGYCHSWMSIRASSPSTTRRIPNLRPPARLLATQSPTKA